MKRVLFITALLALVLSLCSCSNTLDKARAEAINRSKDRVKILEEKKAKKEELEKAIATLTSEDIADQKLVEEIESNPNFKKEVVASPTDIPREPSGSRDLGKQVE